MKRTIIAIAVSMLSLSAMAQTIPDRPDTSGHNFTYQLPAAPVYIEPDLLPTVGVPPVPPGLAPVAPIEPTKSYVELDPPLKDTALPFNYMRCAGDACIKSFANDGFLADGGSMYINHTKSEAEALLATFKSNLTNYSVSDFYVTDPFSVNNIKFDVAAGDVTIAPNFTYNSETHRAIIFTGVITKDVYDMARQLESGSSVVINGVTYSGIIIDGRMVTAEGVFMVNTNGEIGEIYGQTVFAPESSYVPNWGTQPTIREIDLTNPNYTAYQQYLADNAEAMAEYINSYEEFIAAQSQYNVDSAQYQEAQASYIAALMAYQEANAAVIAENQARIDAAQDAYFNSLNAQQSLINESLAGSINHLATTQSIGGGAALGVNSLSIGTGSIASGDGAVAVGNDAWAAGDDSVAMGHNAVAINDGAVAIGGNALAIGGVAIGQGSVSESNLSVAIGTGARAVSSVAVGTGAQAIGTNTTAIGDFAVAAGSLAVSIGANSAALGNNSVAIGANTVAVRPNSVSVGGRQITDVATPTDDTDAANKAYVDQAVANVAAPDLSGLESRINSRIKQVEERADAGTAIALAMTPPIALAPGESAVGAGMGAYGSQQALAVTYAHNIDLSGKPKSWYKEAQFSAGFGGATSGRYGARVGMSFKF